jgi:16S rRNA (cytidine1402-2'-O)-methyltransferase
VKLYIVATPIGNLSDLTERARQILSAVPIVLAEDTRQTRKLLSHIGAHPKLLAYHHHTSEPDLARLVDILKSTDIALVTDAGTPGISDPGGQLIAAAVQELGEALEVIPIPGPSALLAAASISGFPMDNFSFRGFPPHKKGRQTYFEAIAKIEEAVIFFESPHRIQKTVKELALRQPTRQAVICRELTKLYETTLRGNLADLTQIIESKPGRGEYVIVLAPFDYPRQ